MTRKKPKPIDQEKFSQEAQKYVLEALEALLDLGRNAEKETTRFYAWKTILDRGLGPPTQLEKFIPPPPAPTLILAPYEKKIDIIHEKEENKN